MIDFTKVNELTHAANIVQRNIKLTQDATITFGKDGAPEWNNPLHNITIGCADLEAGNQSLLSLMEEAESELFNDCQERHDKGLDFPPQLKKLIDRLFAAQWTIAQCGHYSLYGNQNQEHPSFTFPDLSTDQVVSRILHWLEFFDYCFPGCLSDYSAHGQIPGMEPLFFPASICGQNGGHTEPSKGKDNKSNIFDVERRENGRNVAYSPTDVRSLAKDLNRIAKQCGNIAPEISYDINIAVPKATERINHLLSTTLVQITDFGGPTHDITLLMDALKNIVEADPCCPLGGWDELHELASFAIKSIEQYIDHCKGPATANQDTRPDPETNADTSTTENPFVCPEWLPEETYNDWAKYDYIIGDKWQGYLKDLAIALEMYLKNGPDSHNWVLADGLFMYRGKDCNWKSATADDLRKAFDKANKKPKA